jgi:Zn-dependent protease with chaperone function
MEIQLPAQWQQGLVEFVDKIAQRCKLPAPDEIRLHAQTVAHVYEDDGGRKILVFGGIALATLSRRGLAGVAAHELSHFAAGDTRLVRASCRRHQAMSNLETRFATWSGSMLNPLVWCVQFYHQLYQVAWLANSRATESAADEHTVRLVGAESAAATLLLLAVPEMFPWARVSSIAQECVTLGIPLADVFSE